MAVKRIPPRPNSTQHARGRRQRLLRIIAGQWRGRKFRFPELDIRPTPDRVRETLFNWLQTRIEGAHCLDLYAGSGALGLEALSRGAASVVFVEHQRAAVNALRDLLRDWQVTNAIVVCDEAQHYLAAHRALGAAAPDAGHGLDLVFLDPPYASGELPAAGAALARSGLAPDARIYVEQHADDELQQALPACWRELRTGKAGEVRYHLFAA
jgi:16S rRNA (guanine966-N2)-methyltransferase